MTPKFKTRDVSKSTYVNYLKRAKECFHASQNSLRSQEWNACAINRGIGDRPLGQTRTKNKEKGDTCFFLSSF